VTTFGGYARYYDLLYRDKDYRGETEFVERVIRAHVPRPCRILDLGCGTGVHDVMLAERGHDVTGIDGSEEMLAVASRRVAGLPPAIAARVRFVKGDVRGPDVDGCYDVVLALFHVLSYQLTNDDLNAVFSGVKARLAPDGVFIFDCWYGPAVLTDRPTTRVKRLADENTIVTRIAVPTLHPNLNRVDVRYQLFVKDLRTGKVEEISETHRMRYLFHPELELLAENAGLRIVSSGAWMSDREPDFSTWYVYFVVRHRD
jgi:SAM-dependent methyltransferase